MTLEELQLLSEKVFFRDWEPHFKAYGDGFLFFWTFKTPERGWTTRKWYVSPHSCESEVYQTMLLAALQGNEHEAREDFKVDGKRLYGPHINHQALAKASTNLDHR
jgi:hypothetical protein